MYLYASDIPIVCSSVWYECNRHNTHACTFLSFLTSDCETSVRCGWLRSAHPTITIHSEFKPSSFSLVLLTGSELGYTGLQRNYKTRCGNVSKTRNILLLYALSSNKSCWIQFHPTKPVTYHLSNIFSILQ